MGFHILLSIRIRIDFTFVVPGAQAQMVWKMKALRNVTRNFHLAFAPTTILWQLVDLLLEESARTRRPNIRGRKRTNK